MLNGGSPSPLKFSDRRRVGIYAGTVMMFIVSIVKYFLARLLILHIRGNSFRDQDVYSASCPRSPSPNSHCTNKTYFKLHVEILLRKKVTKSQTWRFWAVARFPHMSVSPYLMFPLFLISFPLFDLDETNYIDSFCNGICDVCIFFY